MALSERRGTVVGTLIHGLAGLILVYCTCLRHASHGVVIIAISSTLWGTFLGYYLTARPSMSEGCSFFTQALFLFLTARMRVPLSWRSSLLLGTFMGLSVAVRYHNVASAWLLVPLLWATVRSAGRKSALFTAFWLFAGFLVGVSPQAYVLYKLYGSPFGLGTATWYLHVSDPMTLPSVLFSSDHGLFYWHPVTLLSATGLILLVRSRNALDRHMFVCFALFTVVNSLGVGVGSAFGARRFSGAIPLLAVGVSVIVQRFCAGGGWRRRILTLLVLMPLVGWSVFLWKALGENVKSSEPLRLGDLFTEHPNGETSDRRRTLFLGRELRPGIRSFSGWGPVQFDGDVAYRSISGMRASLPAKFPRQHGTTLTIRARAFGDAIASLDVLVGRTKVGSFQVTSDWADYTCQFTPADDLQRERDRAEGFQFRTPRNPGGSHSTVGITWASLRTYRPSFGE